MNWCGMNGWREQLAGKTLWPVGGCNTIKAWALGRAGETN